MWELCPVPGYMRLFTSLAISGEEDNCPVTFALIPAQGHG